MNQEETDQNVADEVSQEVDSRGEVMYSEKNDRYFLSWNEKVGQQE